MNNTRVAIKKNLNSTMFKPLIIWFGLFVTGSVGDIIDLTFEDFDDIIKEHPVFIKFYSPSCPHCRKIAPVWEEVSKKAPSYPQYFLVADVDCTAESTLCDRVGVRNVPTLIYFNEGRMYKYMGPREYNDIMKFGAGDYKLATDSIEIPSRGGIVETTRYTMVKFVKDLHAILRFNYWAAVVIFIMGFFLGSLITFVVVVFSSRVDEVPAPLSPAGAEGQEKAPIDKKSD